MVVGKEKRIDKTNLHAKPEHIITVVMEIAKNQVKATVGIVCFYYIVLVY